MKAPKFKGPEREMVQEIEQEEKIDKVDSLELKSKEGNLDHIENSKLQLPESNIKDDEGRNINRGKVLLPDSTFTLNGVKYKTDAKGKISEINGKKIGKDTNVEIKKSKEIDDLEEKKVTNKDIDSKEIDNKNQKSIDIKDTSENNLDKPKIFHNMDEIKNELGEMYLDTINEKPRNSPALEKWFEDGGSIVIDEKDGHSIWTYIDKEGRRVDYIDGFPVFPPEAKHPFIDDINIGEFTGDRNLDKRSYIKLLQEEYGLSEIPDGYALHHDVHNGNMQLIRMDYHKEFTHQGGFSKYKEN